jgi:methionyl aminopeptidase
MIIGKSKKELEKMRAAGSLSAGAGSSCAHGEPGVTTIEIDRAAEKMIRDAGALPTFKGYNGFPYSIALQLTSRWFTGFLPSTS